MNIRKAELSDIETVKTLTYTTISEIYPHYYPKGAVEFFLSHHSADSIADDISQRRVFLCIDRQRVVGTVTVKENEICRLFVLPEHQGNGYGRELLDFAERLIADSYNEIKIDSSLPAKRIYLKRGYSEIEYNIIKTEHGDCLCYDVMIKALNLGEIIDPIKDRRSIRKYKQLPLDKQIIDEIILAALLAPSAKNRQPWKFIVYRGEAKNDLLSEMEKGLVRERDATALLPRSANGLPDAFNTLKIMREAPVLIVIMGTNGGSPFKQITADERVTEICDTMSIGAAVENMLLKATELGIGSLWIANTCFAYDELASHIGAEGQLVGAVALGYADESPNARPRKAFEDVVEYR